MNEVSVRSIPTLNSVFSVTDTLCLAQYKLQTAYVVSTTPNVYLTLFVIPYETICALEIYNVAIAITFYVDFHLSSIIHDHFTT